MTAPQQLPLPLPARQALGRDAFFVSPSNALAVAQIDAWRDWTGRKCVLAGPPGSGKTHLALVWAAQADARIVAAEALTEADVPDLATGPVCVEDVTAIAGDRAREEALFHLHNHVLSEGHWLLITATTDPAHWGLELPDLASRMMAAEQARLSDPDDVLLSALLAKLFNDRQLTPGPEVLSYLTRQMPRSHAVAQRLVAAIDGAALAKGGPVSRNLAAKVLRTLEEADEMAQN